MVTKYFFQPIFILFCVFIIFSKYVYAANSVVVSNSFPQYLGVRKSASIEGAYPFNPNIFSDKGNHDAQVLYARNALKEVYNAIGTSGTENRKLAVSVLVFPLHNNINKILNMVDAIYDASALENIPIILIIDPFNWWDADLESRQLWDSKLNHSWYENVEWYGNTKNTAVDYAWRNWGSWVKVSPHPNLASKAYRDLVRKRIIPILNLVQSKYYQIPLNQKYRYGGIVYGMEISVDVGYQYYSQTVIKNGKEVPIISSRKNLGCKAAIDMGLILSNQTCVMTSDLRAKITEDFVKFLKSLSDNIALPTNKNFIHIGSTSYQNTQMNGATHPYSLAKQAGFIPGWSFYFDDTVSFPNDFSSFLQNWGDTGRYDKNYMRPWASPEWLTNGDWVFNMERFLTKGNNKFINISNWESIYGQSNGTTQSTNGMLVAINKVLTVPQVKCFVPVNDIIGVANDDGAIVNTSGVVQGISTDLIISSDSKLNNGNKLNNINIYNHRLNSASTKIQTTYNGWGFVQNITSGCPTKDGFITSMSSEYPIYLSGNQNFNLTYPQIFFRIEGNKLILSWRKDPIITDDNYGLFLLVTTKASALDGNNLNLNADGTFKNVDTINEDVKGKLFFERNLSPNTYYAMVVQHLPTSSGLVVRPSNILKIKFPIENVNGNTQLGKDDLDSLSQLVFISKYDKDADLNYDNTINLKDVVRFLHRER